MKFFMPLASSEEEAESVLRSIAAFVGCRVPDRRVYSITYRHNGLEFTATVGELVDSYYQTRGEHVFAIFEGSPYLVCTPSRGVVRGDPILVGAGGVDRVTYFDAPASGAL